ncbi:hypothetical protein K438DRAFT_1822773 [Mycena galopus ATCC 62051]|nr:hypothetical protein K438DRAFT_1822773 [Mycena galopus ATCC 62051]
MYFHNAATHCFPRAPSVAKPHWVPFHMVGFFAAPAPMVPRTNSTYLELSWGSEALPRPSKPPGPVQLQLPSGTTDATAYVLSWPPPPPLPLPRPPSTPDLTDDSAPASPQEPQIDEDLSRHLPLAEVLTKSLRRRQESTAKPKGWARLRASAPPALNTNIGSDGANCLLESEDEEGVVMLVWGNF